MTTLSHSEMNTSLAENLTRIRTTLGNPNDLIIREFTIRPGIRCSLVCIAGMIDKDLLHRDVLQRVMAFDFSESEPQADRGSVLQLLYSDALSFQDVRMVTAFDPLIEAVLSGKSVLLIDGSARALEFGSQGGPSRGIEEPQTESTVRGPRDGFTENILTNKTLIRYRIKDPKLRFDSFDIGERSKRQMCVIYIEGLTNPDLVVEAKRRLQTIEVDDPEGSGSIEQWIADEFLTPFPLSLETERPDKITRALMQGQAALLVDGTPFGIIFPVTLKHFIHSPEDFYQNWMVATLLRILRVVAIFATMFLPALYIALVEYHQGMIPSKLAFSIAGSREGVPFPAVIEALLMEGTLELLREAGIRLPKPIGQTIGIVGGLVIGEAAVSAGIVSPVMVIVVAITAVSSFALPSYTFSISIRIIRFFVMLAAGIFGLYGIILAYIAISIHIVNLQSFGVPYASPWVPLILEDWKDLILRAPVTFLRKRPKLLHAGDQVRMRKK
ncbi:spore germination protein [Paenibacillus abyssi]|uniref:Spore germination protein n=1 Tax=Paenibacillus abyssi TaxID=1340531 RepID=A0A917CWT0_9BACL|nr:spore germination protein [Paenibacillus abyssi]GGF99519.1 spore germination protein [Paenibacillus abyssi]